MALIKLLRNLDFIIFDFYQILKKNDMTNRYELANNNANTTGPEHDEYKSPHNKALRWAPYD